MLTFKWDFYAYKLHYFSAYMHMQYIFTVIIYIYNTYLIGSYGSKSPMIYTILIIIGIAYSYIYDTIQLLRDPCNYFEDSNPNIPEHIRQIDLMSLPPN